MGAASERGPTPGPTRVQFGKVREIVKKSVAYVVDLLSPSADVALRLVGTAVDRGHALGISVSCSVCDSTGRVIATLNDPRAPSHCASIAIDKASVAASFRMKTEALYRSLDGNEALKTGLAARSGFALFGGGAPLLIEGQIVGGIGVSGGSEDQDIECAWYAISQIE